MNNFIYQRKLQNHTFKRFYHLAVESEITKETEGMRDELYAHILVRKEEKEEGKGRRKREGRKGVFN